MIELSMEQVRSMFDEAVFERGMTYYREGRVQNVRNTTQRGKHKLECRVKGHSNYQVTIVEEEKGRLMCSCNCYQFYFYDTCKHLAAAMIHCAKNPRDRVTSDWNARNLLKT